MHDRLSEMTLPFSAGVFFALAGLGWLFDQPPEVCAFRAAVGGGGAMALLTLAGRVLAEIPEPKPDPSEAPQEAAEMSPADSEEPTRDDERPLQTG